MFFKLIDLKKTFRTKEKIVTALDGINLDINEGDFISFVGPSGAGKTTLLLLIAGLIKPSEGEIYFESKKLTALPDKEWTLIRKKYMGIIFQKKIIISHLKVYENLIAPLSFYDQSGKDENYKDRIEELLDVFELNEYRNRYPRQLSGGELQRLITARALVTGPELLLADEPTGDLDMESSKKLLTVLKKMNKKGLAVVMVTHNKELAGVSDNIYQLESGKIKKLLK